MHRRNELHEEADEDERQSDNAIEDRCVAAAIQSQQDRKIEK
jgi:hypothetical protein